MAGGIVCLGLLTVTGVVGGAVAVGVAIGEIALAMLGLILIGVRRVDAKVQKSLREHRDQTKAIVQAQPRGLDRAHDAIMEVRDSLEEVLGVLGENRIEAITRLSEIKDHLDQRLAAITDEVTRPVVALDGRMGELADRVGGLEKNVSRVSKTIASASDATYARLAAYADLQEWIQPRAPMPSLHGWAISPDVLHLVVEAIWRKRPKVIVECGSGSSSIWLGYAVQRLGAGRVIALEHDERYLQISRDLVRAHGMEDVVEIRHAPLEPWPDGEREYAWYEASALEDLADIDVLLVDGPPGATGPQARYPALPLLFSRCSSDVTIVLDDGNRPEERAASDRWMVEFPELERTLHKGGSSAHVFTRRPQ
ncbi:MAG: class I SAM-dependent methyltransferase [Actinomadura sp.]